MSLENIPQMFSFELMHVTELSLALRDFIGNKK